MRGKFWTALTTMALTGACANEMNTGGGAPPNVTPDGMVAAGGAGNSGAGAAPAMGGSTDVAAELAEQEAAQMAENPTLFAAAASFFPGTEVHAGNQRLFRLTQSQLELTTRALLPGSAVAPLVDSMPPDPLQNNYEFADNLSFNAANFTPYVEWVASIVEGVRGEPTQVIPCAAAEDACLRSAAREFVQRAFRHAVTEETLAKFEAFFLDAVSQVGLADATADLVDVTLTSPHYVFRDEVSTDASQVLLPAQRLQHLTYTLADSPPWALGIDSAQAATLLGSAAQATATVGQVLATPAARDKLARFFTAWLEIRNAEDFDISASAFPEFSAEVAQAVEAETRAFLGAQLAGAAPSLKGVTQGNPDFVSSELGLIYGSSEEESARRLGIFTSPAFITSHSGPTTTRLIKRGVFFTRKVMCLPLGMPPAGLDTTLPEVENATERARVETATAAPSCMGCHGRINPFGFMLENYDALGRWRTEDENALPIDANIVVDFLEEGTIATDSPVVALRGFTDSLRFQQCFTRQLFRYYMGRPETPTDDPTLRQVFFNFANGGAQDLVQLLTSLAGAPTFAHRQESL